jgi:hypothetical protein
MKCTTGPRAPFLCEIAPVWPAFVIDETACRMVRQHYGTDDVYCLDDWDEVGWHPSTASSGLCRARPGTVLGRA